MNVQWLWETEVSPQQSQQAQLQARRERSDQGDVWRCQGTRQLQDRGQSLMEPFLFFSSLPPPFLFFFFTVEAPVLEEGVM